jgi:hypothetical protein
MTRGVSVLARGIDAFRQQKHLCDLGKSRRQVAAASCRADINVLRMRR